MNSIISLLWQSEIQNISIVPVILKNEHQQPNHYFYSDKQKRVLRKKNPNCILLVEQSQNNNKKQPWLLLQIQRDNKSGRIDIEVSQPDQVCKLLQNQQAQCQICLIEPHLYLIRIHQIGSPSLQQQIELLSTEHNTKVNIQMLKPVVKLYCGQVCQKIETKLNNIQKNRQKTKVFHSVKLIKQMELVLAIDLTNLSNILLIQAVKLKFNNQIQNILQINYQPGKQNYKANNNIKKHQIKESVVKPTNIQSKAQIPKILCCGCEVQVPEQETKQCSNDQIKKLRKQLGLPIRGFTEDSYIICRACFDLI